MIVLLFIGPSFFAKAGDWIRLGNEALSAQDYPTAIMYFTNWIEEHPDDAYVIYMRSRTYLIDGQMIKSSEDLMLAYSLDPELVEQLHNERAKTNNLIPVNDDWRIIK